MPRSRGPKGATRDNPMVPIRVDRLRAAQRLDGRPWPDLARALKTSHPRLFHLTHGGGPLQRRCRKRLLEGFSRLLAVDHDWLSGQTDALRHVVTADAAVINPNPTRGSRVESRWSVLDGTPPPSPVLQLALDRLLRRADASLRRDLSPLEQVASNGWLRDQISEFALLLIAQSVETGFELVQPLPPVDQSEALRLSGILHMCLILKPWFDGGEVYPDWHRIYDQVIARVPLEDGRAGLILFMAHNKMDEALCTLYDRIRRTDARTVGTGPVPE